MNNQMMPYAFGTFVWFKLANGVWWPGKIIDPKKIKKIFKQDSNKIENSMTIVYFERQKHYKIINIGDEICLYTCSNKKEFLKFGYYLSLNRSFNPQKEFDTSHFIEDVLTVEKKIGGDLNIFEEFKKLNISTLFAENPFMFKCVINGCDFKTNKYDLLRQHKNNMHSLNENYGPNLEESNSQHDTVVQNMIADYLKEIDKQKNMKQ